MNWRNVRLIYLREVRDQIRDRRTLFMIAVLPLLLYPALGVGMLHLQISRSEQVQTVVIVGADDLPPPQLLEGDRFISNWFEDPADAKRLRVVVDESLDRADAERYQELADLLAAASSVRDAHREFEQLSVELESLKGTGTPGEIRRLQARLEAAERRRSEQFATSEIQVLIIVPSGMRERLLKANESIRDRTRSAEAIDIPTPAVLYNVADQKSADAYRRVRGVLDRWKDELLKARLRMANLPESLPSEVEPKLIDLARDEELARSFWSKLFPALLVIMTLTGAFYPAVDLAAGEKERGTMETLLICPASRAEIVFGKFLTVVQFSICTALLNLASMGLTGKYMASFGGGDSVSGAGSLAPPLSSLFWVMLLLLPLGALFSALCLALATFARSSKEGQYYLTPLLLITVGLTFFCLLPTVELTPLYSLMPVVGVSLLLRELLAGTAAYVYLGPVLLSSLGYAALALWWAIEQFSREDVLFREAERFELRAWIHHLMRDKGETPSFAEAAFCFVLIMLLQFGSLGVFSQAVSSGPDSELGLRTLKLMMVQQLAIIATPALLMGVILTRSVRKTFRVKWPSTSYLFVAVVLSLALSPLSTTLAKQLDWFFPPLSEPIRETFALMQSESVPVWLAFVAFALAPAICEEVAFRGFILSGFLQGRRVWLAIVLSSITFGIMHMIPVQVFNAALLGIVLGLLAVRSGSLLPGIVFHFIFNGSQIAAARVSPEWAAGNYPWPMLATCGIVAVVLIRWLVIAGSKRRPETMPVPSETARSPREELPVRVG